MKKKKLRNWVLPTLYVFVIGVLFVSISFLGKALQTRTTNPDMSVPTIKEDGSTPVLKEESEPTTPQASTIVKPFTSTNVSISKSFYDMTDDEAKQQNSLVYYENTYLQNSGVLYTSGETFDIVSAYDGTITNVAKDDILGNYVEVTHNTNLKTIYYSLSEVTVKKDDVVKSGTIIGKSGENLLEEKSKNCLLFEVYHNGFALDPEDFYNMKIEELN